MGAKQIEASLPLISHKQGSHSFANKKLDDFFRTFRDSIKNFPELFRILLMLKYLKSRSYSQYSECM